jgi:putative pyruvate formate lyase activating enzyme
VMDQYRPHYQARTDPRYEAINRPVSGEEYHAVVEYARELGLRLA